MKIIKQFAVLYMALNMLLLSACVGIGSQTTVTSRLEPKQNTEITTPQEQSSPNYEAEPTDMPQEDEAAETACFDERLVGSWKYYEAVDNSTSTSGIFKPAYDIFFLPDGTYSEDTIFGLPSFGELYVNDIEPLRISADNGVTDYGIQKLAYYLKYGAIEQEEAVKYSNIHVTYEFFDFTTDMASEIYTRDYEKEYIPIYGVSSEDGMRIHVTADYQKDPLNKQTVDFTYSYYKYIFNNDYIEAYLVGDWTDETGNKWSFSYTADEYGTPRFVFTLTDLNGTKYMGRSVSCFIEGTADDNRELGQTYVLISVKDVDIPTYMLAQLENDKLTLTSEKGDLVLTRAAS